MELVPDQITPTSELYYGANQIHLLFKLVRIGFFFPLLPYTSIVMNPAYFGDTPGYIGGSGPTRVQKILKGFSDIIY